MVVSSNPQPSQAEFQSLLDSTVGFLQSDSKSSPKKYEPLTGRDLEPVVADVMTDYAKGTPFENSIELISGQKFPDIIAKKFYGVEVKSTKQDHWTTTGNSVMEGTRVEGTEKIYMLFGKMISPIDFKCRPYEDCLSEVVVTHSPRYLIDMELASGDTIFDKLDIPYETLRTYQNPVKPIIDYYRQFLKAGEEVWWLDHEEPKATGLIIKAWNHLSIESRNEFTSMAMVFFPEVFGNSQDKFNGVATWLINSHSIVCPNMRDAFTAGGQGEISWKGKKYTGIPKVLIRAIKLLPVIKKTLHETTPETIKKHWEVDVKKSVEQWIDLVEESTRYMKLPFDVKEYLQESISKIK